MTEKERPSRGMDESKEGERRDADNAERRVGRAVALGLPAVCLVSAIVVGFVASVGSALLVAAAGTLLGTIALLWTSLRTLSGDAPLPTGLEELSQRDGVDALAEQKRRALLSLKDLENERALGRIDDADYEAFLTRYRAEAKDVMRRIDERQAPSRADAERVARDYVAKRFAHPAAAPVSERATKASEAPEPAAKRAERIPCATCGASNETDAAFCKHCGSALDKTKDYSDARA
jgi:hypothetical protein